MDVSTFIRVNINGKWTNLGIIADEDEIQEHFVFIKDLLQQKQRSIQFEKRWNKLKQYHLAKRDESIGLISYTREDDALKLMEQLELEDSNKEEKQ